MKFSSFLILSIVIFSFLFAACAKPQYATTDYGANVPNTLLDSTEHYVKPGDRLTIQSLNNLASIIFENTAGKGGVSPIMPSFDIYVDNGGNIMLPKAGQIHVTGMTQREVVIAIQDAYKNIINDPAF